MPINKKDYIFVFLQFLLFIAFIFKVDEALELPGEIVSFGIFLFFIGGLLILISFLQLNKNLSPFPTPKAKSELIQTGIYKYIRHPIYTGIILVFFGFSFFYSSGYKLVISIALTLLFNFKSKYEESCLEEKFSTYKSYRDKTGRFLPKIFNQ